MFLHGFLCVLISRKVYFFFTSKFTKPVSSSRFNFPVHSLSSFSFLSRFFAYQKKKSLHFFFSFGFLLPLLSFWSYI